MYKPLLYMLLREIKYPLLCLIKDLPDLLPLIKTHLHNLTRSTN